MRYLAGAAGISLLSIAVSLAGCGSSSSAPSITADRDAAPLDGSTAGVTPPDVATERCTNVYDAGPGYLYAEHAYPGKTTTDLAALRVVVHYVVPQVGYSQSTSTALVRDGSAAVECGTAASPLIDTVTFILP